jgi:hypothetical protein
LVGIKKRKSWSGSSRVEWIAAGRDVGARVLVLGQRWIGHWRGRGTAKRGTKRRKMAVIFVVFWSGRAKGVDRV